MFAWFGTSFPSRCGTTFFLAGFLGLTAFASPASRAADPPAELKLPPHTAEILAGIDLSTREEYQKARAVFRSLVERDSTDPWGWFFLAAGLQDEMMDKENFIWKEEFKQAVERTLLLAKARADRDKKDAWSLFILGNAYGYLTVFLARQGDWFSGMRAAVKAKGYYEKALKINPQLYDAYVGLGNYHYWKSVRTKAFLWLPFFKDTRKQGIAELEKAARLGTFARTAACFSLMYIYIHEKRYDAALALADSLSREYPESRSFLWGQAAAYFENYHWAEAARAYAELVHEIEEEPDQNYYNLIDCTYRIAQCRFNLGRFNDCITSCEKLLAYPASPEIVKRQEAKIRKTRALLEKAQKITGKKK